MNLFYESKNFKILVFVLASVVIAYSAFRNILTLFKEMQKLPIIKESLKISYTYGIITSFTWLTAVFMIGMCYFLLFCKRKR